MIIPTTLGVTYAKANYTDAIEDYTRAIDLCEKDKNADVEQLAKMYNYRGVAWGCVDCLDKAASDFEEAVRLDPGRQTYRENLKNVRRSL